MFLIVQKNLTESTATAYLIQIRAFFNTVKKPVPQIKVKDIQNFLYNIKRNKSSKTYRNYLGTLKVYFRDFLSKPELVKDFRFPRKSIIPKMGLPDKEKIRIFFKYLPSERDKLIFILLASSGLRLSELLSLRYSDIDLGERMIMPQSHAGTTKRSWITFYNIEAEEVLKSYFSIIDRDGKIFKIQRDQVSRIFRYTSRKCKIKITPQTLRGIFCQQMVQQGTPVHYVDAFCGRVPQSILAKHYSDFSPEVLKEIYDKANLRYFS